MSGALTWRESDAPKARNLDSGGSTTIGRAEGTTVRLDDAEVSRDHAEIHFEGGSFVLANRSRTNPTRINGRPVEEAVLRDQDELLLGAMTLRFHDLSAHDTISGPICSHCGRESKATDRDCWYCGTSLVSALSTLRTRRLVVGRILAETGEFLDLYPGQGATLGQGAPALLQAPGPGESASEPPTEVSATEDGMVIAGTADGKGKSLRTGDVVEASGERYVIIVR